VTADCVQSESGVIEQLFYGELGASERLAIERHVRDCASCRAVVEDLSTLRTALAARPVIEAPPDDDWSGFMFRLRAATGREAVPRAASSQTRSARKDRGDAARQPSYGVLPGGPAAARQWGRSGVMATAAVLALAVTGVTLAMWSRVPSPSPGAATARSVSGPPLDHAVQDGLEALGEEHLQRSKLVVLGLAAKDPARATSADWTYERELASSLLSDTRMYRMAAEERGLASMAEVMRDLEVVLLQTSFTDARDPAALAQIQRLIQKRDLVGKMDVVGITGL
jgi:putative zinc finger protein